MSSDSDGLSDDAEQPLLETLLVVLQASSSRVDQNSCRIDL